MMTKIKEPTAGFYFNKVPSEPCLFFRKFDAGVLESLSRQPEAKYDLHFNLGLMPSKNFEEKFRACSDVLNFGNFDRLDKLTGDLNVGFFVFPYALEMLRDPEAAIAQLYVWYAYIEKEFGTSNIDHLELSKCEEDKILSLWEQFESQVEDFDKRLIRASGREPFGLLLHALKILKQDIRNDISFNLVPRRSYFPHDDLEKIFARQIVGANDELYSKIDWKIILDGQDWELALEQLDAEE